MNSLGRGSHGLVQAAPHNLERARRRGVKIPAGSTALSAGPAKDQRIGSTGACAAAARSDELIRRDMLEPSWSQVLYIWGCSRMATSTRSPVCSAVSPVSPTTVAAYPSHDDGPVDSPRLAAAIHSWNSVS